jgi:hypothetical protein
MTQCSLSGENSTIQVEGAGCLTRPPLEVRHDVHPAQEP